MEFVVQTLHDGRPKAVSVSGPNDATAQVSGAEGVRSCVLLDSFLVVPSFQGTTLPASVVAARFFSEQPSDSGALSNESNSGSPARLAAVSVRDTGVCVAPVCYRPDAFHNSLRPDLGLSRPHDARPATATAFHSGLVAGISSSQLLTVCLFSGTVRRLVMTTRDKETLQL